ncbi:MAG: hypothetical protein PUJ39_03510 [Eubacteriales bacterium]|nr:hypothetical protein [Eubacteriales bacterium]
MDKGQPVDLVGQAGFLQNDGPYPVTEPVFLMGKAAILRLIDIHGFLPEMTVFWGFRLITACFFDRDHAFPQRKHNFPVCGKLLYRGFSTESFPHKIGFAGQNRAFSVENYVES